MKQFQLNNFDAGEEGSVAVLLCILFASLLLAIAVILDCAGWEVAKAYAERMTFLSARSVLAQYDENLWHDYGLFAYIGTGETVAKEVSSYLKKMERRQAVTSGKTHLMFDVWKEDVTVDPIGGTLFNKDLMKQQILSQMKMKTVIWGVEKIIGLGNNVNLVKGEYTQAQTNLEREKEQNQENGNQGEDTFERESISFEQNQNYEPAGSPHGQRVLRNNRVIQGLPSKDYSHKTSFLSIDMKDEEALMALGKEATKMVEEMTVIAEDAWESLLVNGYIMEYMGCATELSAKPSFFANEIEYILNGSFDDEENYQAIQTRLFLLRTGLNLIHIYTDEQKRTLTMEVATAMGGPLGAAPVQFLLCVSWASLEAKHDLKILNDGGAIALFKENEDWALSLDSLLKNEVISTTASLSENRSGLKYKGYLNLFLLLKNEDEKLLKCMDLIQINMKGRYQDSFDLRTCISRFSLDVSLLRKQYTMRPGIALLKGDSFLIKAVHSY